MLIKAQVNLYFICPKYLSVFIKVIPLTWGKKKSYFPINSLAMSGVVTFPKCSFCHLNSQLLLWDRFGWLVPVFFSLSEQTLNCIYYMPHKCPKLKCLSNQNPLNVHVSPDFHYFCIFSIKKQHRNTKWFAQNHPLASSCIHEFGFLALRKMKEMKAIIISVNSY